MAWLALGTLLLAIAAAPAGVGRVVDAAGAASLILIAAAALWSLKVYPWPLAGLVLLGSAALGLLLWPLARRLPLAVRLPIGAAGAGALLFALFGPADGLF